mmetsp:Transcript_12211/g.23308  ORF Transcript_12211/g.23308 Transcript_12211/m.23308 type:complete len:486 (+) Transcript_12211:272-1729(+)
MIHIRDQNALSLAGIVHAHLIDAIKLLLRCDSHGTAKPVQVVAVQLFGDPVDARLILCFGCGTVPPHHIRIRKLPPLLHHAGQAPVHVVDAHPCVMQDLGLGGVLVPLLGVCAHLLHRLVGWQQATLEAARDARSQHAVARVFNGGEATQAVLRQLHQVLAQRVLGGQLVSVHHEGHGELVHQHQNLSHHPRLEFELLHLGNGLWVEQFKGHARAVVIQHLLHGPVVRLAVAHQRHQRQRGVHVVDKVNLALVPVVRHLHGARHKHRAPRERHGALPHRGLGQLGHGRLGDDVAPPGLGVDDDGARLDTAAGADAIHHARHHAHLARHQLLQLLHRLVVVLARVQHGLQFLRQLWKLGQQRAEDLGQRGAHGAGEGGGRLGHEHPLRAGGVRQHQAAAARERALLGAHVLVVHHAQPALHGRLPVDGHAHALRALRQDGVELLKGRLHDGKRDLACHNSWENKSHAKPTSTKMQVKCGTRLVLLG